MGARLHRELTLARNARWRLALATALLFAGGISTAAEAQWRPTNAVHVQPATYRSSSGTWELFVNPSEPDALGSARYTMRRDGVVAWDVEKAFTLTDVAISDRGVTLGVSQPPRRQNPFHPESVDLVVVILGPDGATRQEERDERPSWTTDYPQDSSSSSTVFSPEVAEVRIQNTLHRGSLRVLNRRTPSCLSTGRRNPQESYWTYDLNAASPLESFPVYGPEDQTTVRRVVTDSLELRGTPLMLELSESGFSPSAGSRHVSLLDAEFQTIWRARSAALLTQPVAQGSPAEFAIYDHARGMRVRLRAEPNPSTPSSWRVRELAREACAPPAQDAGPTGIEHPYIDLQLIREVPLGFSQNPPPAVRDIVEFTVRRDNTIEFIRLGKRRVSFDLVRINMEGEVLVERNLRSKEGREGFAWTPTHPGGWLSMHRGYRSISWRVPAEDGQEPRRVTAPYMHLRVLAALPKGGYVAVTMDLSGQIEFRGVASDHRLLFEIPHELGNPETPLVPTAAVVTARNEIVLLEEIAKVLRVYSMEGEFLRLVRLDRILDSEFESADLIAAMPASSGGGILLSSSRKGTRLWQLDEDFTLVRALDLEMKPGRQQKTNGQWLRVDQEGAIWTTDGQSLTRHAADGSANLVLGERTMDSVHAIEHASCSTEDTWVLRDEVTGATRVFDGMGKPLPLEQRHGNNRDPGPFAHFDGRSVRVTGTTLHPPRTLARRADGWFWSDPTVGADARGRIVAIERGQVFLYNPENVLEQAFSVPEFIRGPGEVHFAGDWVVIRRSRNGLTLIDLKEQAAFKYAAPIHQDGVTREIEAMHLSQDGDELRLLVDHPPALLHYALP